MSVCGRGQAQPKLAQVQSNSAHLLTEDIGIFRQQGWADNPPLVLRLLEVRIREEEEHLAELQK